MKRSIASITLLVTLLALVVVTMASAQFSDYPGTIIFDQVVEFDQAWLDANPDAGYVELVITLPGPGYVSTWTDGYRPDPGCGERGENCWCAYGGGVRFFAFDGTGEQVAGFGTGDAAVFQYMNGGTIYAHVDICKSSNIDPYPYRSFVQVYFDPDSDQDGVSDSLDNCPATPPGSEVDEVGCAPTAEPPGPAFCNLWLTAFSDQIRPGESLDLMLEAYDELGAPLAWTGVTYDISSGPGLVVGGASSTDGSGQLIFTYQAPTDIVDPTLVTVSATVNGCPEPVLVEIAIEPSTPADPPQANTPTPATGSQLEVSLSRPFFQQLGEEVDVVVTLLDENGRPLPGEPVWLVDQRDVAYQGVTGQDGIAWFTVTHLDQAATHYDFLVQSAGAEKAFSIPVGAFEVTLEMNPATGEPFIGLVADGISNLQVILSIPFLGSGRITFGSPQLGQLSGEAIISSNEIQLDAAGRAELIYVPPDYLPDGNLLTERIDPHTYAYATPAMGVLETLSFSYMDPAGATQTIPVEIRVFRPPLMMVHGFVGSDATWALLAPHFAAQGFDISLNDYAGLPDSTIQDLSELLRANIEVQKQDYARQNVRLSRVDIIAHSMGGIISRFYAEESQSYAGDVRKLLMVGTPNHGVDALYKRIVVPLVALYFEKHLAAGLQLYSGSDLFINLNAGEVTGRHLNPEVEYANLIGRRRSAEQDWLEGMPNAYGDGVVSTVSSHLNGVVSYSFSDHCHSADMGPVSEINVAITESPQVWAQLHELLLNKIERRPLDNARMEVIRREGGVWTRPAAEDKWQTVTTLPTDVQPWHYVNTGQDSRALIGLYLYDRLWGSVSMNADTELVFDYVSPELVRIYVKQGRARFRSLEQGGGGRHFEVVMGERNYAWHEFNPRAWVLGFDTDFVVSVEEPLEVASLEGRLAFGRPEVSDAGGVRLIMAGQASALSDGIITDATIPSERWWDDPFFQPDSLDELLGGYEPLAALLCVGGIAVVVIIAAMVLTLVFARRSPRAKWILIVLGTLMLLTLVCGCLASLWFYG